MFYDWAYGQFGAYAVSTQAWDSQRETQGVPGETLAEICEVHWQFERFKASLLPRLDITSAKGRVLYTTNHRRGRRRPPKAVTVAKGRKAGRYRIVEVTATVANTGCLATHLGRGAALRGNRDDVVWLLGDRTDPLPAGHALGPARRAGRHDGDPRLPAPRAPPPSSMAAEAAVAAGSGGAAPIAAATAAARGDSHADRRATAEVTWLVAVEGDVPLKIALSSQKGGTIVKDVVIN